MPATSRRGSLHIVSRSEDIPRFSSESEEAAFWAAHRLSDELLGEMGPLDEAVLPAPRPRTTPVAIRFDASTLGRLKMLAAKRGKGYQTLLKEFVVERLYEEERREGIVTTQRRGSTRRQGQGEPTKTG